MNAEEPDGACVSLRRGFAVTFVQYDGRASEGLRKSELSYQ